jgi:hypothetical protein
MRTIWKFVVPRPDNDNCSRIAMPRQAHIRAVQMQNAEMCIWAEVEDLQEKEYRYFYIFGTGHQMPNEPGLTYIGTVQIYDGKLVFHVYERTG